MYEYLDKRYALALYEIAEKDGKVEEYIKELSEVLDLIKNNEELSKVVKHSQITTSQKKKIFKFLLKGKVSESILSFILILIEKDRIIYLEEKINEMEKIHLERQNILVVQVKTVIPLNEDEKKSLIDKLRTKYNKNILLKEEIDKSLIGGIYLRAGNDVIDNTIKLRLKEIRRNVLAGENKVSYSAEMLSENEAINLQDGTPLVAKVKTVIPLNEDERRSLVENLKGRYNRDIILKEEIDESLIGGMYIRIGRQIMDNTIRSKLNEAKRNLTDN